MFTSEAIRIQDPADAGLARRTAVAAGEQAGLDETERGKLAIVVTELARNIALHARVGELIVTPSVGRAGVEIVAIDRGPGITDIPRAMRDGYSTAGTRGEGLGAVQRLSDFFEIFSTDGNGVAIVARVCARRQTGTAPVAEVSGLSVKLANETDCGDAWSLDSAGVCTRLLVVDGLGHGSSAAEASQEAISIFERRHTRLDLFMEAAHNAMRKTRGGSVAVAHIDHGSHTLRYAGVGNISGVIAAPSTRRSLISYDGTVGHVIRKVQEFSYPWLPSSLLVMHSDGISTKWDLDAYPGLAAKSTSMIAAVIYRDFRRERDDATVVVARDRSSS